VSRPTIPPDLAPLLEYLGAIGYGDLYLRERPAATSAGAGAPASSPTTSPAGSPTLSDAALEAAPRRYPDEGEDTGPSLFAEPPPPVARPSLDPEARVARLAEISAQVAACRLCKLCLGRGKTVFGSGSPTAELMFIGEGPGAEEDRQGLPFVGRAGELLTKIIQAIGRTRDEVYIANIVKCRPPGNRDPQPDEVAACRPYLEEQIALVAPRVIVALGRIAAQTLLGTDAPIGRLRGRWFTVLGVPTMVTYHPAALLRNPALKRPTWEDMQQVRDRLQGAPA
jgi:uracil-DNA glycosylase